MLGSFILALSVLSIFVESTPNVLISKNFNTHYAIQDSQYTIQYTIFNLGDYDVTDVQLDDRKSFPTNKFEIHSGSLKVHFHRIPARNNVSHAVVVTPRVTGETVDQQAIIFYHDSQRNEDVTGRSTSAGQYMVYNAASRRLFSSKFEYFMWFAAICGPLTVLSFFFYTKSATRYTLTKTKKSETKSS